MPQQSPLMPLFRTIDAPLLPYGPPEEPVALPAAISYVEAEYAAIRKHAAILDQPHRGTLVVRGDVEARHEFLGRMLTQDMRQFAPFTLRRSFWLNRKGRIDADLRLAELGDHLRADLDIFSAGPTVAALEAYLFAEDVQIENASDRLHRLGLHGPAAAGILIAAAEHRAGPQLSELADGQAALGEIAGTPVVIERQDALGVPGFELTMDRTAAEDVWHTLASPLEPTGADSDDNFKARPIGWHAYNIARIEAGWALYNVDFGLTNLPHETGPHPGGILRDRVSFTKGCYLGQEIVARMESLGKPKQVLIALRLETEAARPSAPQPATGSRILREATSEADLLGAVTSSAISPMLGGVPICFAMVKQASSAPGTRLFVEAEDTLAPAVVQPSLRFWPQS